MIRVGTKEVHHRKFERIGAHVALRSLKNGGTCRELLDLITHILDLILELIYASHIHVYPLLLALEVIYNIIAADGKGYRLVSGEDLAHHEWWQEAGELGEDFLNLILAVVFVGEVCQGADPEIGLLLTPELASFENLVMRIQLHVMLEDTHIQMLFLVKPDHTSLESVHFAQNQRMVYVVLHFILVRCSTVHQQLQNSLVQLLRASHRG